MKILADAVMDPPPKKKRKPEKDNVQVIYTDQEVENKGQKVKNKNTLRGELHADKAFRRFLDQAGVSNTEYWTYPIDDLDKYLAKFYLGARKYATDDDPSPEEDPEQKSRKYLANTLKNVRYALNRHLHNLGKAFDIVHDKKELLPKSTKAFETSYGRIEKGGTRRSEK